MEKQQQAATILREVWKRLIVRARKAPDGEAQQLDYIARRFFRLARVCEGYKP